MEKVNNRFQKYIQNAYKNTACNKNWHFKLVGKKTAQFYCDEIAIGQLEKYYCP
jgi:hypothetical protein